MSPPRADASATVAWRPTSWIDPLPEQPPRTPPAATASMWFVLGGVSATALAAVAIATWALRLAGGRRAT